jgi:nitrogen fixation/metabolism regulation signal transduction histidine kinase
VHHKLGKELKRLMTWVCILTTSLFILVVTYFMLDVAVTTKQNIRDNKQLVIKESVNTMQEMAKRIAGMSSNADLISRLNVEGIKAEVMQGKTDSMLKYMMDMAFFFYPLEYIGETRDGKVIAYKTADGSKIDTSTLPAKPTAEDYVTFKQFGGRKGFFISLYGPIYVPMVGNLESNFIVDRTKEINDVETYLNDQRNNQLLRMGIVSIIAYLLCILLTTVGLYLLVQKYVMGPIDDLNNQAEGIIDGTLAKEIPYDKDSSFASIQGVLRSGQKVLMEVYKKTDDS